MEIKLFGKSLFQYKSKNSDLWTVPATEITKKMTHLPDFKTTGSGGSWASDSLTTWSSDAVMNIQANGSSVKTTVAPKIRQEKEKFSPKRVYDMKMLHDASFKINMDPKYVDGQIADFKEKLGLMNDPSSNYKGFGEIGSILIRMENRKKYASVRSIFEKFPYTTNARIENVIKKHDYLKLGEIDQFVVDLPKEATDVIKEYNTATEKICGKKAVFYIIADKKDFQKTNSRTDPILLGQSPFGHFWQILGAWDKEMLFIEEL